MNLKEASSVIQTKQNNNGRSLPKKRTQALLRSITTGVIEYMLKKLYLTRKINWLTNLLIHAEQNDVYTSVQAELLLDDYLAKLRKLEDK